VPGHVNRRSEASPSDRQRSNGGFRQARYAGYFVEVSYPLTRTGDENAKQLASKAYMVALYVRRTQRDPLRFFPSPPKLDMKKLFGVILSLIKDKKCSAEPWTRILSLITYLCTWTATSGMRS
jgi:hypothetical protein